MLRQSGRSMRKREPPMPENIQASTTDHKGDVYLLVKESPDWWMIKSAAKIANNGKGHRIQAAGDRGYVVQHWREFVTNEKRQIAANYDSLAEYSIR
jgi:hypothetical protein